MRSDIALLKKTPPVPNVSIPNPSFLNKRLTAQISAFAGMTLSLFFVLPSLSLASTEIHVLDVGYGQAVLVQTGTHNFLFDTGLKFKTSTVFQVLADHHVTRLDGIFLSHTHKDHAGGLLPLLQQIKVDGVYWNGRMPAEEETIEDLNEAQTLARFNTLTGGEIFSLGGGVTLRVLRSTLKTNNLNEASLVFTLTKRKQKALLPGDAGFYRQKNLVQVEREALKNTTLLLWPHHGDTLLPEFREALGSPLYCVVSVGKNEHSLPHATLEEQGRSLCRTLYRTDSEGNIAFAWGRKIRFIKPSSD